MTPPTRSPVTKTHRNPVKSTAKSTKQTEEAVKLSISLPAPLIQFIEDYQVAHQCKSRSQVIEIALMLLRYQDLEAAYREASQENQSEWEVAIADGLADEAW